MKTICQTTQAQNWKSSRAACVRLGYRLLEIDSNDVLGSLKLYLQKAKVNKATMFWVNGIANSKKKWDVVDPSGPWLYRKVAGAKPGLCLSFSRALKTSFGSKACSKAKYQAWCEKKRG